MTPNTWAEIGLNDLVLHTNVHRYVRFKSNHSGYTRTWCAIFDFNNNEKQPSI